MATLSDGPAASRDGPRGRSRAAHAYVRLRELIVRGALAPGARIIETDVAERLGVSRTPVRDALRQLQQEGYVVASGRGVQARLSVAPLTRDDARELFSITALVEGLAARGAAERAREERLRHADVIEQTNTRIAEESRQSRPDLQHLFELDERFHRQWVEAGAGPRLLAMHASVKPQIERYARLYVTAMAGEVHSSVEEHEAAIAALRAGDSAAAERALQANWQNALARLEQAIGRSGERGAW
jgi:DNA-binding GntR family transcriptional regulator